MAEDKGCEEMLPFATSAVRDAANSDAVLAEVRERTGVDIAVLPGEDEARLTFLAVRRWFGWSSGRLAVFDIGGGSLEIAAGGDEAPDVAWSLPLGAARLARDHLADDRSEEAIRVAAQEDPRRDRPRRRPPAAQRARPTAPWRRPRRSGRWPGSAAPRPRATGRSCRGRCRPTSCASWIPKLAAMSEKELRGLAGVSPSRTHQILPGALVARRGDGHLRPARARDLPWALREGVILERIDAISRDR